MGLRPLFALALALTLGAEPVLAQTAQDEMAWNLVRDSADPQVLERFIAQFPQSAYTGQAQEKLKALNESGAAMDAPAEAVPTPAPQASPGSYALDVQRELKRVGCYGGRLDGAWGSGSRRALGRFAEATGSRVGTQPTAEVLAVVKAKSGTVCTSAKPAPKGDSGPTDTSSPPTAGCYDVFVTVDTLYPTGEKWDPWPGNRAIPDPLIRELTTGARSTCADSYSCGLRVSGAGSTLQFTIVDDDPDRDDPVGAGQCRAGSSCRLGSANLRMSRC